MCNYKDIYNYHNNIKYLISVRIRGKRKKRVILYFYNYIKYMMIRLVMFFKLENSKCIITDK